MSGMNLSEAGCSLWICLKTSIAGLFGSIFFAEGEIKCGFGKFLPFKPRCVITERVCRFAIGCLKCNAELLVFDAAHSGNEIFSQKIGGTSGDLDRKLDERFRKLFIEVCSRRDQNVWNL